MDVSPISTASDGVACCLAGGIRCEACSSHVIHRQGLEGGIGLDQSVQVFHGLDTG
jgi:hypothetical protein